MKQYGYYRPSSKTLSKKRKVSRGKPSFFIFKAFFLLILLGAVLFGGYLALTKGYAAFKKSDVANWSVKKIDISGMTGLIHKEIAAQTSAYQGKRFGMKDSIALRADLVKKYPMLKDVSVTRGLFSGTLKISADLREPIAQFKLPDNSVKYVDKDSTVYSDPNPTLAQSVPVVEIVGEVPSKLKPDFIDLVQSTLKLDKKLNFETLRMNLAQNTVTMILPDKSVLHFGKAERLKQKAQRASQIMAFAREHYKGPVTLNFAFFDEGKVFLTQSAH